MFIFNGQILYSNTGYSQCVAVISVRDTDSSVPFELPSLSLEALRGWSLSTSRTCLYIRTEKELADFKLRLAGGEDGKAAGIVYQWRVLGRVWVFVCH